MFCAEKAIVLASIIRENRSESVISCFFIRRIISVTAGKLFSLLKKWEKLSCETVQEGYDYIFIARNTIVNSKCADVKKSIEAAFKKAGLLQSAEDAK